MEVSHHLAEGAVAPASVLFLMLVGLSEFFACMSVLCRFTSLQQKVQHA